MELRIEPVPIEQKPVLWRLLQLYLHDLSEFDGSQVSAEGEFRYDYFEHYWDASIYPFEPRFPFFIFADEALAGFALIRHMQNGKYQMSEFCILRKHRRSGIGFAAAAQLFQKFPGPWDLTIHPRNVPAQEFWPKVIEAVGVGEWQEKGGALMTWHIFEVAPPRES